MIPIRSLASALTLALVLTGCRPSVPPQPAAPCQGTFQSAEPIIVAFPDHPPSPPSEPEFNVAAIDCGDFSAYLDAAKLDLGQLQPGRPYTYWEWVFAAGGYWDVIASGGQVKRSALSSSVVDDLDRFTNGQGDGGGFAQSCEPGLPCSEYIAFVAGDEVSAVTALTGIRKFLGEIDTPEDVVLLIRAWGEDTGSGDSADAEAILADETGYSVVLIRSRQRTDPDCGVIASDSYRELAHVSSKGEITVVARRLLGQYCETP